MSGECVKVMQVFVATNFKMTASFYILKTLTRTNNIIMRGSRKSCQMGSNFDKKKEQNLVD